MSRRIPISLITQSGINPGTFLVGSISDEAAGDWTGVFLGKFFRQTGATGPTPDGGDQTWWSVGSDTPPSGYTLIAATQFDVVENSRYAGRYTVYTKPLSGGLDSSSFSAGATTIRVNEAIGAPLVPADLTTGAITNISTYYLVQPTSPAIVVSPGTEVTDYPTPFVGRSKSGWGEVHTQNHLKLASNFAGPTAPANPFNGQTWYNTTTNLLMIWDGAWTVVNSGAYALEGAYRSSYISSMTWTVVHGLGSAYPAAVGASLGLANATFIVDTGGAVYKPIIPQDVTYDSADQLTVTFSAPYAGYALIRL